MHHYKHVPLQQQQQQQQPPSLDDLIDEIKDDNVSFVNNLLYFSGELK